MFYVGATGLLVHNSCADKAAKAAGRNGAAKVAKSRGSAATKNSTRTAANKVKKPKVNEEGGVDFAGTKAMYPVANGQQNIVKIKYTGRRPSDYKAANEAAGLKATQQGHPGDATWHHLDDYDPATNTGTMQLVYTEDHVGSLPHKGGVKQFEDATGFDYKQTAEVANEFVEKLMKSLGGN